MGKEAKKVLNAFTELENQINAANKKMKDQIESIIDTLKRMINDESQRTD